MGWKKFFEIGLWRIIISLFLILSPYLIRFFVGGCKESNPLQCTDKFTEFYYSNRSFQFILLIIAVLSLIWLVSAIVIWIVGKIKK